MLRNTLIIDSSTTKTDENIMKRKAAKSLIINYYSEIAGFKISENSSIGDHLVLGVKLGEITPRQAAEKAISEHEAASVSAMKRAA